MWDMVNFLKRLFGMGEVEAAPQSVHESPREDMELSAVREKNFRKVLDEYRGRPVEDDEFAMVRRVAAGGDESKPFPRFVGEEAMSWIALHAQEFGWTPELVPDFGDYPLMGNRQGTFEKALSKALGGVMTEDDLEDARAMFEGDQQVRAAWDTMFAHDVENYAAKIAARVRRERLRKSSHDQDYGVAAK
jgi:hypothetical protein